MKGSAVLTAAPGIAASTGSACHEGEEAPSSVLDAMGFARGCPVACFAHVTNTMAQSEGDFEKGEADGALEACEAQPVQ